MSVGVRFGSDLGPIGVQLGSEWGPIGVSWHVKLTKGVAKTMACQVDKKVS